MLRLLVATDGSEYSDHAVDYAMGRARACRDPVTVHLLNVQTHIQGVNVKIFISKDSIDQYYRDEGMRCCSRHGHGWKRQASAARSISAWAMPAR